MLLTFQRCIRTLLTDTLEMHKIGMEEEWKEREKRKREQREKEKEKKENK